MTLTLQVHVSSPRPASQTLPAQCQRQRMRGTRACSESDTRIAVWHSDEWPIPGCASYMKEAQSVHGTAAASHKCVTCIPMHAHAGNVYLQSCQNPETRAGAYLEPGRGRSQAHDSPPGGLGLPAQRGVDAVVAVRGDFAHGELRQEGHAPREPCCATWCLSHND